MSKEDLEKLYGVHIDKKENKYYIYTYFSRLVGVCDTLFEAQIKLQDYFKEVKI